MVAGTARRGRSAPQNAYTPYGASRGLMGDRSAEILIHGPAGTGKSRACLEKLYLAACNYPGMRGLMVRKTRTSMTQSVMVTWEQKVLPRLPAIKLHTVDQEYRFPNGSVIVVGGMDQASRIMSTEYDLAYVQEATELTEDDWESISTRLRNGAMPYQQLIGDCNPDAPSHWLRRRADVGKIRDLPSRHEDNPELWDAAHGKWTEKGAAYISRLDDLTGVRFLRLRKGIWAAAEGMVYEGWDRAIHLIERFDIPREWPRYWSVDFGYTNPFCWQAWARDPDGRLYRYREIYRTQRLVEDHAKDIKAVTAGDPHPIGVICDHDAEGRATLERYLGLKTLAAHKTVTDGIQAVQSRLKVAGDGKPRVMLLRDSLTYRDPVLEEKKLPQCSEEEIDGYVWDLTNNRKKGEEPVKDNDHGMDAMRYLVARFDLRRRQGYTF